MEQIVVQLIACFTIFIFSIQGARLKKDTLLPVKGFPM